jgi:hypothetical protein
LECCWGAAYTTVEATPRKGENTHTDRGRVKRARRFPGPFLFTDTGSIDFPLISLRAAVAGVLPCEGISQSDDEQVAARMAIAKGRKDGLVVMLMGSGRSLVRTERSRDLREGLT